MTDKDTIVEVAEVAAKVVATEVKKTESDIAAAESRRLSLIWEWTQALIAMAVVLTAMMATIIQILKDSKVETPGILTSALFLVMGYYFGRNQTRVGRRERASDQFRRGK